MKNLNITPKDSKTKFISNTDLDKINEEEKEQNLSLSIQTKSVFNNKNSSENVASVSEYVKGSMSTL